MGAVGIIPALMSLFLIRDPRQDKKVSKSSQPQQEKKKSFSDFISDMKLINSNPTCRNVLIAGAFRSFGNMAVSCYLPVFF